MNYKRPSKESHMNHSRPSKESHMNHSRPSKDRYYLDIIVVTNDRYARQKDDNDPTPVNEEKTHI